SSCLSSTLVNIITLLTNVLIFKTLDIGLHYLIHIFLNSNGFFLELPLSKKLPYPYTCITHLLPLRKPVFLNDIPCLIPLVYPRHYTPCLIWSAKSSSVSTNFSIFSLISEARLSKSSPIFTASVIFPR